jgi:hypothetical protein
MTLYPNLESDLLKNDSIAQKCINNDVYAQNLYATLCNNQFFYNDNTNAWSCSWRYSGGIVSQLVDTNGNYLDYYCSGAAAGETKGYISEGTVSEEIKNDLLSLGWTVKAYENI